MTPADGTTLNDEDVDALWLIARKLRPLRLEEGYREPVDIANRVLKGRRERAKVFGPSIASLFGEAAYDMLLDLYVAHVSRKSVSVSSACIAAGVPSTTALRMVRTLVDDGIVTQQADPADGRRKLLRLPDDTARQIEAHLLSL